jgi:hypothetical protein
LTSADNGNELDLALRGEVPVKFALSIGKRCSVRADGQTLKADSMNKGAAQYSVRNHVIDDLRILCTR